MNTCFATGVHTQDRLINISCARGVCSRLFFSMHFPLTLCSMVVHIHSIWQTVAVTERVRMKWELRYSDTGSTFQWYHLQIVIILWSNASRWLQSMIFNRIHTILKLDQITVAYKNVYSHSMAGQLIKIGIWWNINFNRIEFGALQSEKTIVCFGFD